MKIIIYLNKNITGEGLKYIPNIHTLYMGYNENIFLIFINYEWVIMKKLQGLKYIHNIYTLWMDYNEKITRIKIYS